MTDVKVLYNTMENGTGFAGRTTGRVGRSWRRGRWRRRRSPPVVEVEQRTGSSRRKQGTPRKLGVNNPWEV